MSGADVGDLVVLIERCRASCERMSARVFVRYTGRPNPPREEAAEIGSFDIDLLLGARVE